MAKSTIKVKHLGVMSTGKFMAVYTFLLSLVQIAIGVVMMVFYFIVGLIFGLGSGDSNALGAILLMFGGGLIGFIISAILAVVGMTILGFLSGVIGAFVFNIGVKLSGGLRLDAEIQERG